MNRDRKILLIILFFTLVISASALNLFILGEKHTVVRNRITLVEQNLNKMGLGTRGISVEEISFYKDGIEAEKARYFERNETDPFKFAIEIKSLLESEKLTVNSYKSIESENSYLIEFSIEGSSVSFFRFLDELNQLNKNYIFPQLSLKNEKKGISSVFRIGYLIYE
jgi:hypothetical protein